MSLLQIFDVALVTLALTSILLTLISYGLYKFRQMPKSQAKGSAAQLVVEGTYFGRYLPADFAQADAQDEAPPLQPSPSRWKPRFRRPQLKTVGFYSVVASGI